jgi:RNA polymerase sigma-70 factor, ECF subfamily
VVLVPDGGGVVAAGLRPVTGARRLATLLSNIAKLTGGFTVQPMWLNGGPAARFEIDGALDTAVSLVVEDGRVSRIFAVRNPHKLSRVDEEAELSR